MANESDRTYLAVLFDHFPTIEEYLLLAYGLFVTHGISPDALLGTLPKPKW